MSEIRFASSLDALSSVETLLVVARSADLEAGWPFDGFSDAVREFGPRLAKEARPGRLGGSARSLLTGDGPQKLVVIALHDEVSRHLSSTRSYEIYGQLRTAISGHATAGVVIALTDAKHALGAALAVGRSMPLFSRKTSNKDETAATVVLRTATGPIAATPELTNAANAVRLAQRLVDTPPADLTTAAFEQEARDAARGLPHVSVESIVGDDLLTAGLRGLHAVGRTAMVAPRIVVLDYNPPNATDTIALVGKGLVYDTGGLSLKIVGDRMLTMKCDMGGAAAVLGAFCLLAQRGGTKRVIAALSMAENAIGPDAYRPDDILEMHSGKTVEINNTDAEGRLALADAASYLARKYFPSVLIDAATLTGAQLMATGKNHAGIVSNEAELEALAIAAGHTSGDHCLAMLWSPELLRAEFKSKVADMRNSVADRMNASSAAAGLFVYSHIEDCNLRWLHIDLAGPAFPDDRATGYGVGLIADVVTSL